MNNDNENSHLEELQMWINRRKMTLCSPSLKSLLDFCIPGRISSSILQCSSTRHLHLLGNSLDQHFSNLICSLSCTQDDHLFHYLDVFLSVRFGQLCTVTCPIELLFQDQSLLFLSFCATQALLTERSLKFNLGLFCC